jgi:cytochrome-b5 reductase
MTLPIEVLIAIAAVIVAVVFLLSQRTNEGEDKSVGLSTEELSSQNIANVSDPRAINPAVFKKFKLIKSTRTSYNTKLLRFEVPENKPLGLPIGRHISLMIHLDGNKVMRPYTPVSRPDEIGHFEILIKSYALGKMSPHLFNMKEGDSIDIRGPVGRFKYSPNMYKHIGLICAGTGLTPCLQVVRCILEGADASNETTKITLVYQNRKAEDILLRSTLVELEQAHPDRLQVFYFLSNAGEDWGSFPREGGGECVGVAKEQRGYVDQRFLRAVAPRSECDMVGICGPSGFNDQIVAHLECIGYEKGDSIYVW